MAPKAARAGGTPPAASRPSQLSSFILRVVAVVLTFIAAIVMGTAKQRKLVDFGGGVIDYELKFEKSYFVVINVLAFLYSAFSLAISIANRAGTRNLDLPFAIADLLQVVLLFSANSAATALSVIAENGNTNLLWGKVCNFYDEYCTHITASIVLSFFASLSYLFLVLLAIFGLHRRSL